MGDDDLTETSFKHLSPNDLVIVDGRSVKILHAHFCDGENEPLQFVGGNGWKTCAALRVFFDDGSDRIVHPDESVRLGLLN